LDPIGTVLSMRIHDTGPRAEPHYPEAKTRGHDYGTRGGEALERPFLDGASGGVSTTTPAIEEFFYRVRAWVRSILR
jgi:hypothetical protein